MALAAGVAAAATGCDGQSAGARAGLTDERLGAMIDSLLPEIAGASGLEALRPVRYAVQERAEARSFIEAQLDDELGSDELAGVEGAYRAFGLIPDTLELRALLLELYTEQVVGYYDPDTERLYVVEGVAAAIAEPVVAHELVHALQDQHVDLDSLVARERGNDRQLAAQAAAEGQATLVMVALEAARSAGGPVDLGRLPDLGAMLRPALEAQNDQFPVFQRAPRLIRETLIFPYFAGAAYVQRLNRAGDAGDAGHAGPVAPFGDFLPQSTEQVLAPRVATPGSRDAPTEVTLGEPGAGWRVAYTNGLGQLEVGILLAEHLGDDAREAATGWDGDRYALLAGPDGARALVWYSVWDDAAAADRFARAYRDVLRRRPGRAGTVERAEVGGRPVVRVVETAAGADPGAVAAPALAGMEERPAG